MDSSVSEKNGSRQLRRSTRQSTGNVKVLTFEATPRGPLKRTRNQVNNRAPAAAVNGSRDEETGSGDDESPSKKSRPETGEAVGGSGDGNEMDVQETVEQLENNEDQGMDEQLEMDVQETDEQLENNEDQEMDILQNPSRGPQQPKIVHGALGDVNLSPLVLLGERHKPHNAINKDGDSMKTQKVKPSTKAATKSAAQTDTMCRPPKQTSMAEYRKTMEAKANSSGTLPVKHRGPRVYPASAESYTTQQRARNIPPQKVTAQHKKQEMKKSAVIKRSSGYSCKGFMWCLWRLLLLALLCSALLLACKSIPVLKKAADGRMNPSSAVKPDMFADQLSLLQTEFPSQRPELWKRSKIHLERHLHTTHPTEPVSLILTAGLSAERTLKCLAQRLAASFSSALNASVLHIDGASNARRDSDQVKQDIDDQLRAAFEGDQPVAVIHRFEELPPGSTLIFYRYCDHENAAYKRVFLLFTVLLPDNEVSGSLKEVEEKVQDYVKERLVDSSLQTGFNEMDIDKYSGLWSRISHLVLPVVSEEEEEREGC